MARKIIGPQPAYEMVRMGQLDKLLGCHLSENFTWGEVFHKQSRTDIFIADISVFERAFFQANETMELIRAIFNNKPITVTSWYRSPLYNRKIGGASRSRHIYGDATDFVVSSLESVAGNKKVQQTLHPLPFMQIRGMEWTGGRWTHVDSRGTYARFTP